MWPLGTRAQQSSSGREARIGLVALVPPPPELLKAFRDGMRERGYIEGQNLIIEVRWPKGTFDQDPNVVTDLAKTNVDLIVAWATPAVMAVHRATSTIPIVMVSVGDPARVHVSDSAREVGPDQRTAAVRVRIVPGSADDRPAALIRRRSEHRR